MTIIWIIMEVLFIFMFYKLPPIKEGITEEETSAQSQKHLNTSPSPNNPSTNIQEEDDHDQSLNEYGRNVLACSQSAQVAVNPRSAIDETSPLIPHFSVKRTASYNTNSNNHHEQSTARRTHDNNSCCHRVKRAGSHLVWSISELLREEMVVLLAILFTTMFSQTTTEVRTIMLLCSRRLSYCSSTTTGNVGAND